MHAKGHQVSGSDDEIYEPSRSRLAAAGLLPEAKGWFPEKIHAELKGVILGMHARADNPELLAAKALSIPVYSFPEFVYEQSRDKLRVVISGSHGKTTITAMLLHVLRRQGIAFDYLVGAQLEGFQRMVQLSDAPLIVIEGDEYLTSPLDPRPKFLHYHPHHVLLSGIAWDHFNVFPTFADYRRQFSLLLEGLPTTTHLYAFEGDEEVMALAAQFAERGGQLHTYNTHPHRIAAGTTHLLHAEGETAIAIFGAHNMQNLAGAQALAAALGVSTADFYSAIADFKGAAKRQEILAEGPDALLIRDFAHAPSKLQATVEAVKGQFPERRLLAVQELHTYSSLNEDFLPNYAHTMDAADEAILYMNPKAVALKRLQLMSEETLRNGFKRKDIRLFTTKDDLFTYLAGRDYSNSNLLLMSSGNFDDMELAPLVEKIRQANA
ncbi:Mur ligase middle domain-containing protein [Nitritalea halalkaliphila LW7]|uniref:Mur ligase middle domain-containing protein n=1 Tax=Nitritalea halalkaliphila LW7 TaxID=1189621 RepID=I5C8G8_9BACT|nr:Mur ligase family protein [Nitritalea halalkaliphila]EIM78120.1 Mur ligase middle domain-containing protein [Nitritalea halalkaliphila LW7]